MLPALEIIMKNRLQSHKDCQPIFTGSSISASNVSADCQVISKKITCITLKAIANEITIAKKKPGSVKCKDTSDKTD